MDGLKTIFPSSDIVTIVARSPSLLTYDLKILQRKMLDLRPALRGCDIERLIGRQPSILEMSVDKAITPRVHLIRSLLGCDLNDTMKYIQQCPEILTLRPTRLRRLEIHRPPAPKPQKKVDDTTLTSDTTTPSTETSSPSEPPATPSTNTAPSTPTATSESSNDGNVGADARGLPADSPLRILFLNETDFAARYPTWTKPAVPDRQAPWVKKHPVYQLPKRFVKNLPRDTNVPPSSSSSSTTSSSISSSKQVDRRDDRSGKKGKAFDDNKSSGSSSGIHLAPGRASYQERQRLEGFDDESLERDASQLWGRRELERDQGVNVRPLPRRKGQGRDEWARVNKLPGSSDTARSQAEPTIEDKRRRRDQFKHQKEQTELVARTQAKKQEDRERKQAELDGEDDGDTIVEDYRPTGGTAASPNGSGQVRRYSNRNDDDDEVSGNDSADDVADSKRPSSSSSNSGKKRLSLREKYAKKHEETVAADNDAEHSTHTPSSSRATKTSKSSSQRNNEKDDDEVSGREDIQVPIWAQKPSDYDGGTGLMKIRDSPIDVNRRLHRQPQDDVRVWQSAERRTRSQLNAQRSGRDTGLRSRAPNDPFSHDQWPREKGTPRFNEGDDDWDDVAAKKMKRKPPPSPKTLRRKEELKKQSKKGSSKMK
jgi:hypothetical protein